MAVYRLRKVWPEYRDSVRVVFRTLAIELKNRRSTPKPVVDVEIPLMLEQEPELPIVHWRRPDWQFVPTLLPAFEAEKAAADQGDEAAWEFAWQVRHAFFAKSSVICMRWELEAVARTAGLDVERFLRDWDSGRFRPDVLAESHRGWEILKVPASPTFVLPSGEMVSNPGAITVKWGPNHEVLERRPANCPGGDCLQVFRDMLKRAAGIN